VSNLGEYYDSVWRQTDIPPYLESAITALAGMELTPGAKVLDVACGNGILGKWLIEYAKARLYGVDLSPVALERCRQIGYLKSELVDLDNELLPFAADSFDLVTLSAVLEHVMEPEQILIQTFEKLKPGGYVFVLTPNISWIVNRFLFLIGRWDHRLMGGTKGHISYMNKQQLQSYLAGAGFIDLDWSYSVHCVAGKSKVCQSGLTGMIIRALNNQRVHWWPALSAFNFIVTARKPG
jgi:2-polyprenyl-3-methyl-5-hydroxy-6-metoxy-1,4-benzoquinol methylase